MEMEDNGGEFVYESDEWEDGEIDLRDDDEIDREKVYQLRIKNWETINYLLYVDKRLHVMKEFIKRLVYSDQDEKKDQSKWPRIIDVSINSQFYSNLMSSEHVIQTPAGAPDDEGEAKEEFSDISSREKVSKRVRSDKENGGISEKRPRVDREYQEKSDGTQISSDAPNPETISIPRDKYPYVHKVLDSLGIKIENVLELFHCVPILRSLQKIIEKIWYSISKRHDLSTQENRTLFMNEVINAVPVDDIYFYQIFSWIPKEELMEHLAKIMPNSKEMTPEAWPLLIKILECYRPVPVNLGEKPVDIPDFPLPKMMEQLIDILPKRLEPDTPVNSSPPPIKLRPEPLYSEGHTAILTLLSIADPDFKNNQSLLPPPTLPEPQDIQPTDLEYCEPIIRLLLSFSLSIRCSKLQSFIHHLSDWVQRSIGKPNMIARGYVDYALKTFVELILAGSLETIDEQNSIRLSTFLARLQMESRHLKQYKNFQSVVISESMNRENIKKRLPHDCLHHWISYCYNFLMTKTIYLPK